MSNVLARYAQNIGQAKVYDQGGLYVEPGDFIVDVMSFVEGMTRESKPFVAAELFIHASTNAGRPVGTTMNWFVNLSLDAAAGNIKAFLAACFNRHPDQLVSSEHEWIPLLTLLVSQAQPLKGRRLYLHAWHKPKRRAPAEVFTACKWTNYAAMLAGQAA